MAYNLQGKNCGRLTVLKLVGSDKHKNKLWLCLCECGNEVVAISSNLYHGRTQSCGCILRDMTRIRSTTHGHTKNGSWSLEYECWKAMVKRCTNPKFKGFSNYGGRGIIVCERWMNFENFYADMGDKPSPKHSIERNDVNKGYSPENCRWATSFEQAINRRLQKNNTSGVQGVPWNKRDKRWTPSITAYGKQISLGSFKEEDKDKAIEARRLAEIKYWNKQPS